MNWKRNTSRAGFLAGLVASGWFAADSITEDSPLRRACSTVYSTITQTVTSPTSPPPMPQGSALPSPLFHVPNVGATYYVSPTGSDSTGTGTSGNPWATPQKAHDELTFAITWPTNQDVRVVLRNGTYQKSSGSGWTLDMWFGDSTHAPNANRWLIFEAENYRQAIIESPNSATAEAGSVRLQTGSSFTGYISFRGIRLFGGNVRRALPGNGNSNGLFLSGSDNNDVEFIYGEIDGFQSTAGGTPNNAQALQRSPTTAAGFKFAYNRVHDIGTTTGTDLFAEHGYYSHSAANSPGDLILNNLFYNMVNGYGIQFYGAGVGEGTNAIVAHNTLVGTYASGIVLDDGASNATLKNNIYAYWTGRGASSWGIEFFPPGSPGTGNVVDYALYYANTTDRSASPSGWTFTHETNSDPLFVNAAGGNYHLTSGSPARGYSDTAYSPPFDLDGNPRPPGSEDAGAFEFVSGTSVLRPSGMGHRW